MLEVFVLKQTKIFDTQGNRSLTCCVGSCLLLSIFSVFFSCLVLSILRSRACRMLEYVVCDVRYGMRNIKYWNMEYKYNIDIEIYKI